MLSRGISFCALLTLAFCNDLTFPQWLKFGAATSSYQIEGGWNTSDKSENIWDVYTHTKPHAIHDHSNGDVACDSYNLWQRDLDIAAELGLDFYRFSLSWARLLPSGFRDKISEDGVKYYNNVINGLLEKGIEPVITIYHWDMPQSLQDLGGWTNPMITDWFADYAEVVYNLYGDRVKTWITINEPIAVCEVGYGTGIFAPGIRSLECANYICAKNILVAHAKAWRIYDRDFRPKFNGKVGITNQLIWLEAANKEDEDLAELARHLLVGLYSNPIYSKNGGWPPLLEKKIDQYSKKKGFSRSRLPAFTNEEIKLVKGTYDFYGINYYTARTVSKLEDGDTVVWPNSGSQTLGVKMGVRPEWKPAVEWLFEYPEGLRYQLRYLKEQYGDIPISIFENGWSIIGHEIEDNDRVEYIKKHLKQVLLSIKEDGVRINKYTVWTLIDNFEWTSGYLTKFGLYEVDFNSPNRTRTPRASAKYYADVIRHRSLDVTNKSINDELYQ